MLCYLLESGRLVRRPVGVWVSVVARPLPLISAAPEDELAAAAGLVLVVRLLAARVERLPRPVQLDHQGNLQCMNGISNIVHLLFSLVFLEFQRLFRIAFIAQGPFHINSILRIFLYFPGFSVMRKHRLRRPHLSINSN